MRVAGRAAGRQDFFTSEECVEIQHAWPLVIHRVAMHAGRCAAAHAAMMLYTFASSRFTRLCRAHWAFARSLPVSPHVMDHGAMLCSEVYMQISIHVVHRTCARLMPTRSLQPSLTSGMTCMFMQCHYAATC